MRTRPQASRARQTASDGMGMFEVFAPDGSGRREDSAYVQVLAAQKECIGVITLFEIEPTMDRRLRYCCVAQGHPRPDTAAAINTASAATRYAAMPAPGFIHAESHLTISSPPLQSMTKRAARARRSGKSSGKVCGIPATTSTRQGTPPLSRKR